MMQFSGDFTVDGTPEELWKYFTDPEILKDCAPGCNKMELKSPSHIVAGLTVGVGSVKPSFDVEGIVTACDRPNRLEIEATGEASRNSFEMSAWQELHDNGDGTTTVAWEANAEVSGIIASLGERAIGSVADKLVNEFFEDMEDHVNAGTPAESKLQAADSDEMAEAEELEADAPDAGGSLADAAVGVVAGATSEDGPGAAGSFAAGLGAGLVGSALLRRLLGSGSSRARRPVETTQQPAVATEQPRPPSQTGRPSLLVLGLTALLGAAGAVIWQQSQPEDAADSTPTAPKDGASNVPADSQSTEDHDPTKKSNGTSDNPLDRLESRR